MTWVMSGTEWTEPGQVTCSYCNRDVPRRDVPQVDDDAAWAEEADDHAADCEWIKTRAHRTNLNLTGQPLNEYDLRRIAECK